MSDEPVYVLAEQERPRPLTGRNLEDYALCPRKYLLSHFETREDTRRFLGGPAALSHALREALVEYHRVGRHGSWSEEQLLAAFEAAWEPSYCADSLEEEQLERDGRRMLGAYVAALADDPVHVADVDVRFELAMGPERFVAVADRVDTLCDGRPRFVRFTSARRPPSPGELAQNASALLLLLLGMAGCGRSDVEVGYYALRPGRMVTLEVTEQQIEQFRDTAMRRARVIRRDTEFRPNKGKQCRWCRSRPHCPVWQP